MLTNLHNPEKEDGFSSFKDPETEVLQLPLGYLATQALNLRGVNWR